MLPGFLVDAEKRGTWRPVGRSEGGGAVPMHALARDRVVQAQVGGMQQQPGGGAQRLVGGIQVVAQNGVAQRLSLIHI